MEEEKIYAKKLECPDFSDPKYKGKNLMMYEKSNLGISFPVRLFFGEVTPFTSRKNEFYMKGFTLRFSKEEISKLEKQIVFGRKYFGEHPYYEYPITNLNMKEHVFYELLGNLEVEKMRDIATEKNQRLVIEQFKS